MKSTTYNPKPVDLLAPSSPGSGKLLAQVSFEGITAIHIKAVMEHYHLGPAGAVRMLVIDGLQARGNQLGLR
jgi:hypothetical protein